MMTRTQSIQPHGWLWLVCLLGLVSLPGLAETRDPGTHFFDQSLGDFTEELALARDEGKKGILIMFEMDECPFCHRMKTTVLNQSEVQDYYKENFLIFSVDIEGDIEIVNFQGETKIQKDFAFQEYRVRATPVFAFFDLDGQLVTRYTGATRDPQEFLWLGQYVVEEAYRSTSFTRYKRDKKS